MNKRVYLANCLGFCSGNNNNLTQIVGKLETAGFTVFEPFSAATAANAQQQAAESAGRAERIFHQNIEEMEMCDLVVALLDGNGMSVDDGVAFEMGFCYAKKKPVYGIRSDMRTCEFDLPVNLQLFYACASLDGQERRLFPSVEALISALRQEKRAV